MKVIFFHVGSDISTPTIMVESARRFTDDVVMLTDQVTPEVPGCSEVHRYDGNPEELMLFRMQAYAAYNAPGVYIDTDVIIQHDLSPVMALDFHVAVTERTSPILSPEGDDVAEKMPLNAGVIFCKHPQFFAAMANAVGQMDKDFRVWWGDQVALAELAKRLVCLKLPTAIYNRTYNPRENADQHRLPWVLHFKGNRKQYMRDYLNSTKDMK